MNKAEKRMVQSYWETTGGILLESFHIVDSEDGERISADAVIVVPTGEKHKSDGCGIAGKDIIIVYAVEGKPGISLAGKALISLNLIMSIHNPKSLRLVILCTQDDQITRKALENQAQLILYDEGHLISEQSGIPQILAGEPFRFICNLEPLRDYTSSQVREYYPDLEYKGSSPLHKHGQGPFCVFTVPVSTSGLEGVYALLADDEVMYIGSCEDLYEKFHFEFGHIQPRDCYKGGHPEQCRINHLIMQETKEGKRLRLVFSQRSRKDSIVAELIRTLKPKWNIHGKRAPRQRFPLDVANITDFISRDWGIKGLTPGRRYKSLTEHLSKLETDETILEYDLIEKIIGRSLPPSAYTYSTWWSNGNRSQARSWLAANWRVKGVEIGKKVIFRRVDR